MRRVRKERTSLYSEVTKRIIADLEEGRLPWVQPWDRAACGCTMPHNAGTGRKYGGINALILWAELVAEGYASQRWLTYRQAEAAGGNVRRGERGTAICYADRFTPRAEAEAAMRACPGWSGHGFETRRTGWACHPLRRLTG
jgi:Antirestriction protein